MRIKVTMTNVYDTFSDKEVKLIMDNMDRLIAQYKEQCPQGTMTIEKVE